MECVEEIKKEVELSEMQKRGAIKLTFKKGERIRMKNYRSLTLLNLDFKIITKAFEKRVWKVISKLIHQNQTCVPGRHIEDNIHIVQNLIDNINKAGREITLIQLDQIKSFDSKWIRNFWS